MKFGRFSNMSAGQLLDLKKYYYLRWVYYHCSQINYDAQILNALHIDEEWQINKPGTNSDIYYELNEYMLGNTAGMLRMKVKSRLSKGNRIKKHKIDREERYAENRGTLQARNHGHSRL